MGHFHSNSSTRPPRTATKADMIINTRPGIMMAD